MKISSVQLQTLIDLMIDASNNTMLYWKNTELCITLKSDQSPLTVADLTTNTIICQKLSELFPDIPIISEENSNEPYSKRCNYTLAWLVDPIDGTKEFIAGKNDFTVNIGLILNETPVMGFVSQPVENRLYLGWTDDVEIEGYLKACASYQIDYQSNKLDGSFLPLAKPLKCICAKPDEKLRIVASKSHMNEETRRFLSSYPDAELVNIGSSLKIIRVADNGKAHLYPRLGLTSEWDTAAAHAILLGAGGHFNRIDLKEDGTYQFEKFTYNKPNLLNPYFIVRAGTI